MTQETTKQEAAKDVTQGVATEPTKELNTQQAENVGGGTDICNINDVSGQISQTYDNLVDATSHIIETVAKAL